MREKLDALIDAHTLEMYRNVQMYYSLITSSDVITQHLTQYVQVGDAAGVEKSSVPLPSCNSLFFSRFILANSLVSENNLFYYKRFC